MDDSIPKNADLESTQSADHPPGAPKPEADRVDPRQAAAIEAHLARQRAAMGFT